MQRVLEEGAISEYGLFQMLPMDLVLLHPDSGYSNTRIPETSSVLRFIPDTKQTTPDTTQTPQALCYIGNWKKRQYLSFITFHNILLRDLVFLHPRHPKTPSRHHLDTPDTIQTKAFLCNIGLYIEGKFPYYIKTLLSGCVWICVCGCLEGVGIGSESVLGCMYDTM